MELLGGVQKIISKQQNIHIAAIQIPNMKKTISRIILSLIVYGIVFCLSELFALIYVLNYPGVNFPLIYEIRELLAFEEFEGSLYMIALILMFQTFALSLFGEILAVNTGNIGDSLYLTEWYAMPLREQTSILFMMRLGQKSYGIKAGGLVAISFNTFVDVIKASMSYCALLYALTKN
ncbi:odorant receptor 33b-like [Lutzomyia longipalpis]|uniref:odorant receptor 33b-like n=1 Tax=Lutzomyia longipalpis TaxID=7200 RepID=UPI002483C2F3|nr:odorant receptor 33b-like [Lutzomyia longipalpis]